MAKQTRQVKSLDSGWRFSFESPLLLSAGNLAPKEPSFDDSNWRLVNIPHDYVIEQPYTPGLDPQHGSLPTPPAWYRKTFTVPSSSQLRTYWLDFEGIFRDADVYMNGVHLGRHQSGYLPAHFDVTPFIKSGQKLTIAVRVDPSRFEGWWYEGGGIYRHVWFTSLATCHIVPDGVRIIAKPVGSESNPTSADLEIEATVAGSSSAADDVTLEQQVTDLTGRLKVSRVVDKFSAVPNKTTTVYASKMRFENPKLWSIESPHLYKLITTLKIRGKVIDRVETNFGVRTVRFDPDRGFFLNGKQVKIKGVCNHQDFASLGIAVPGNLEAWRVKKMKDMGANAWRAAHNPPSKALLDACDKLGMLVLDENRHLGDTYDVKTYWDQTPAEAMDDLRSMIVRDRNHPSIIAWSLCNEEPLQGTVAGARILKKMLETAHVLDPTRPVTCAMNGEWGKGFTNVVDIQGCNYFGASYSKLHADFPKLPILFTETSSAVSDRGVYKNDWKNAYIGSYTEPVNDGWPDWVTRTEESWKPIAENDYLAGCFVWTGFDYRGEPSPFGWPSISSHFGILDLCGLPKDVYYYYAANWKTKPLVHIVPHWTWSGKTGSPIEVVVFTNTPKVELSLNGKSLGAKSCPANGHVRWQVPYQPGTLAARGLSDDGRLLASESQRTAGQPKRLRLRSDLKRLKANGQDVSVVEVEIVDSLGRAVPTADNDIDFEISGRAGLIVGSANGDPSDHTSNTSSQKRAFSGKAIAIVRSTGAKGQVQVKASSPGLESDTLTLSFL